MRRNIELKARTASLQNAQQVAQRIGAHYIELLEQTDTYFHCRDGRLKLREFSGAAAQLIWYRRSDELDSRESNYQLAEIPNPDLTRDVLARALGVLTVVTKKRQLYLSQTTRIHLDHVIGLGDFLEFEVVLGPNDSVEEAHRTIAWLRQEFQIAQDDCVANSYSDLRMSQHE